jgi:hypothetical protein
MFPGGLLRGGRGGLITAGCPSRRNATGGDQVWISERRAPQKKSELGSISAHRHVTIEHRVHMTER